MLYYGILICRFSLPISQSIGFHYLSGWLATYIIFNILRVYKTVKTLASIIYVGDYDIVLI